MGKKDYKEIDYDLDDYSKGYFIINGEIYTRVNDSDEKILKSLYKIFYNHPSQYVQAKALESIIVCMSQGIMKKYC